MQTETNRIENKEQLNKDFEKLTPPIASVIMP